ncbi:MAG: VanZ family protein [Candidatus Bipolaricaulia bacterium]
MTRRYLWWITLLGYTGLIFYLSNQPSIPMPARFPGLDKLFHWGEYLVLTLLAIQVIVPKSGKAMVGVVIGCLIYAASDELHQMFVPGREADVFDGLADAAGVLTAVLSFSLFRRHRYHRG